VQLESVHGVLVKGGAENNMRTRLGEGRGDIHAAASWHLDIQ